MQFATQPDVLFLSVICCRFQCVTGEALTPGSYPVLVKFTYLSVERSGSTFTYKVSYYFRTVLKYYYSVPRAAK